MEKFIFRSFDNLSSEETEKIRTEYEVIQERDNERFRVNMKAYFDLKEADNVNSENPFSEPLPFPASELSDWINGKLTNEDIAPNLAKRLNELCDAPKIETE